MKKNENYTEYSYSCSDEASRNTRAEAMANWKQGKKRKNYKSNQGFWQIYLFAFLGSS